MASVPVIPVPVHAQLKKLSEHVQRTKASRFILPETVTQWLHTQPVNKETYTTSVFFHCIVHGRQTHFTYLFHHRRKKLLSVLIDCQPFLHWLMQALQNRAADVLRCDAEDVVITNIFPATHRTFVV